MQKKFKACTKKINFVLKDKTYLYSVRIRFVGQILLKVKGVKFIDFTEADVMRHPLIAEIVKAYDNYESSAKK